MFAGHSAFRFKTGPLLFERLRADREAAGRADPDRRLTAPCSGSPAVLPLLLLASPACRSSAATAQPPRETPYWASIASGQAMMRTGPGQQLSGHLALSSGATCRSGCSRSIRAGARSRIRTARPAGCSSACSRHAHRDRPRRRAAADARGAGRGLAGPLPRRARRGRADLALRQRLVPIRRRRPHRLHPGRPYLGGGRE